MEQRQQRQDYSRDTNTLGATIEETSQVGRIRETNLLLSRRLDAAQDEVETCHNQIARQASSARALQSHCDVLTQQVAAITAEAVTLQQREQEIAYQLAETEQKHHYAMQQLQDQLNAQQEDSRAIRTLYEQSKNNQQELVEQLEQRTNHLNGIQSDAQKKDQALDDLYMLKEGRGPSTYMLEIEQLKNDNRRLITMLQQTKQFKDFAGFVEDSGGQVRAIYTQKKNEPAQETLESKKRKMSTNRSSSAKHSRKTTLHDRSPSIAQHKIVNGNLVLLDDESNGGDPQNAYRTKPVVEDSTTKSWVPEDAFKTAHQFRQQHGDEMSVDLVNMLLSDLNKIWSERERRQIQRISQKSKEEVNDMKRKLSHKAPYDFLVANKSLHHFQSKFKALALEISKITGKKDKKTYNDMPAGLELIEHTLQLLAQMQQQKKLAEQENTIVNQKLKTLENLKRDEIHDKNKFMEGAIWMGRRISAEVERTCQSFETMAQEYRKRFGELQEAQGLAHAKSAQNIDLLSLQRAQVWFLESVKQLGFELYEQTVTMLESALQLKDDAEMRIGEAYSPVRNREQNEQEVDIADIISPTVDSAYSMAGRKMQAYDYQKMNIQQMANPMSKTTLDSGNFTTSDI